ncbi:MAG: PAS domain-containing protein [Bryobacteraceae bacterium]|nr:PAS domain-containing protein [Bryobacteraceae bacterium]
MADAGLKPCRNLIDEVPCFISVQDRDLRIIEANRTFVESFGSRIGAHCYEVYKRRSDRCPDCPVLETFDDGKRHADEHVWIDSSGKEMYVVVHTSPIRDSLGEITAVMEVSDDITELRTLQDKLAALGGLVSSIAHSIKNMLEGLRGGVYIVNLGLRDNNQRDIRTGWEMVERNVGRLSAMILDMLYCSKDRAPRRLPVSVSAVAKEVAQLFAPRAAERSIRLDAEIAGEALTVPGEPKDVHSLISNLLANAIDACAADESDDKESRVVVRVLSEGNHAVVEVEDNGPGMDDETRARLFSRFFSTKGGLGTGLGLMVAHKVATEHGGTIAVRSAPGEGATFTVRLPMEVHQ